MRTVKFEIQIDENNDLMMKANRIIHECAGWSEEQDGEIPVAETDREHYLTKICQSIDLTNDEVIRNEAAMNMNDAFNKIAELIIGEIPNITDTAENKGKSTISFEIIVPDNVGDGLNFCDIARTEIHDIFKGSQDYIDSNVVVWSKDDEDVLTETGVTIFLNEAVDKIGSFKNFIFGYFKVVGLPEYYGIIFN